jgi:methanogenic corrinoid protein MtbC1
MAGDAEAVRKLAQDALNEGITASDVLNRGLLAGMDIVGNHSK